MKVAIVAALLLAAPAQIVWHDSLVEVDYKLNQVRVQDDDLGFDWGWWEVEEARIYLDGREVRLFELPEKCRARTRWHVEQGDVRILEIRVLTVQPSRPAAQSNKE